jgi:hypothetical protein
LSEVMPGAVTFLHEAGSALNLNPHSHSCRISPQPAAQIVKWTAVAGARLLVEPVGLA